MKLQSIQYKIYLLPITQTIGLIIVKNFFLFFLFCLMIFLMFISLSESSNVESPSFSKQELIDAQNDWYLLTDPSDGLHSSDPFPTPISSILIDEKR